MGKYIFLIIKNIRKKFKRTEIYVESLRKIYILQKKNSSIVKKKLNSLFFILLFVFIFKIFSIFFF